MKKSGKKILLSSVMITALLAGTFQAPSFVQAAEGSEILINEIESDAADGGNDWIEIINTGKEDVDISGWFVTDDKELERLDEGKTTPLAEGTVLKAGEVMVLEENSNFTFGLGKEDNVCLYDGNKEIKDSYAYSGHAYGTWSRVIGTDSFTDQAATKGTANLPVDEPSEEGGLVINEINSSPADYVELMNTSEKELDISGYEIRDNSDDHRWQFLEVTTIAPGQIIAVEADTIGNCYNDTTDSYERGEFQEPIGIGSGDSIRLYDGSGQLIDQYSWTEHASYDGDEAAASLGRYPDGTGSFVLMKETPGQANQWYVPELVINEIESDGDTTDWVEVYNAGNTDIDISGYYLLDNDPVGHADETVPVTEGTVLAPGEYYVFDQNKDFTFGLGNGDTVTIFSKGGAVVASYEYASHANGVYARIPDGTGDFVDFASSTKGKANIVINPVVLNEIQSNDPNGGADWIELANPTAEALDVSGLVIKDDKDDHGYTVPDGTVIPANGFIVIYEDDLGFGLGKGDQVRIFEDGRMIQSTTWADHTNPTWGLYPDVNGSEYRNTQEATPGSANRYADIPELLPWQGDSSIETFDDKGTFLEDSSGLDFANGKLYAVDNGTATFWVLNVAKDGQLTFEKGFESGKKVSFIKDAGDDSAAGPDAEGITVDGDGFVYLASERDNSDKGVNYNAILKVDPNDSASVITAEQEWDITALLPQVSANMGIEAVEWVANEDVDGLLYDENTKAAFDHNKYPEAVAGGVFFVALEDNGHVYAFVLNNDGTAALIADIDSKLGGAMALDYDTYEDVLWVASDNGYNNRLAKIALNGSSAPVIEHYTPASGLDTTLNYEGFAIAAAEYTVDGQRPVYRFQDGVTEGALAIGYMACDYKEDIQDVPGEVVPPNTDDSDSGSGNGDSNSDSENTGAGDENTNNVSDSEIPGTSDNLKLVSFALIMIIAVVVAILAYRIRRNSR